ncbi:DUF6545 domain-containing protein [Embleya sp. NPDC059237]|uniref:DUF6545 domain-containing protein n=1 Tax=Embleya sp. NPDC059237 TaxID=3346784 RepID=UPI003673E465
MDDLQPLLAACEQRLEGIAIPRPFDLDAFRRTVEELRCRDIGIAAAADPDPSGGVHALTVPLETTDWIFHDPGLTGAHFELVVLHELAHLICGHTAPHSDAPDVETSGLRGRHGFAPAQESEAEMLASLIYARATSPCLPAQRSDDGVPGRLTTMLDRHWTRITHERLRALRPLWDLVVPAIPDAVLPAPPGTRPDPLGLEAAHMRLVRDVVEIRDGMLALRRYADPDLCDRLRIDLEGRGLTGAELQLATVAAWTVLTADALRRGKAPQRVELVPPRPPLPDLDAQADRLIDIEAALHWPATGACVEELSRTLAGRV